MLTVQEFLEGFLKVWETAKHSVDPDDSGNYFKGSLVGSKYGVTGAALAKHRGVAKVTKSDVAGVTLKEASDIARVTYYDEAQFDVLPWSPVVASAVDKCYMSGEDAAVRCMQRAAGVEADGHIGPKTIAAVKAASEDLPAFAQKFATERQNHEAAVIRAKPVKAKYRNGWNNRTKSYLPGTPWWASWKLETPMELAGAELPVAVPDAPADDPYTWPLKETVSETAAANNAEQARAGNVVAVAKSLSRDTVTEVLNRAPAGVVETAKEAVKLKLGEKSTWIGGAIVAASTIADPSVQAALRPAWQAIKAGNFGGIATAIIGLGLVIARSRKSPRVDSVLAAKRLVD
jgi:lysozyme family protein